MKEKKASPLHPPHVFRLSTFSRWGLMAALAVMLLSLYPQLNLIISQRGGWHGSYAYIDTDEVAYSAYLNALIAGRPRLNDPYTGRDDDPHAPQSESLFSIQFLPPIVLSIPARLFGLSASNVFILLMPLMAFASTLALFRLMALITRDERWSAVGVLCVLLLGTFAAGHGAIQYWMRGGASYDYFPFLRRYLPGTVFPLFFILCACVWRMLTGEDKRHCYRNAIYAGIIFDLLVFSYFYLWTAAVAWLASIAVCWMLARPAEWRRTLRLFGVIVALALPALVAYALLLSQRMETMDAVVALSFSHAPDLLRNPELIGICVLLLIFLTTQRGWLRLDAASTLFTASFALLPLLVFNQQVITGRSLQPIHYEQFIANYISLLSVFLYIALLWRGVFGAKRKLHGSFALVLGLFALGWGALETRMALHVMAPLNAIRDEARPVAVRLAETARETAQADEAKHSVALTTDSILGDDLPSNAPVATLWARHMHVFAGVSLAEDKERFYQYLYFTGVDEQQFANRLERRDFNYLLALFGWTRTNPNLRLKPEPIKPEEIVEEIRSYSSYSASFNHERAARLTLSFLIISPHETFASGNLDRWYERDAGELVNGYYLYRLKLRP